MKLTELEFYLEDFLIYCQSRNLSNKTISSYEQSLKLFIVYLKNEQEIEEPEKVKSGHIRQYIKYCQERGKYTVVASEKSRQINHPQNRTDYKKTISNITINNYIRIIKVFFNWLHKEGEIRKNPVENIEKIKTVRRKKVEITEKEFRALLEEFDYTKFHGYRNKIIVMLLQDTGMRISETLALKVDNIDFKHRMILVTKTKGKKERYVFFSQQMNRELRHYIQFKERYTSSSLLFPTMRNTEMSVHSFEKQLKQVASRIELSVHPHQIRNNFARQYLMNGGDIYTLSRILGHSSVKVTEEAYLDLTDEEIAKKYHNHSPLAKWRI
ncbi:tyrosine-type recombinase/integrase [Ureibacillus aquaedulcis]|uniref:Tyrosine-type recombinase/integrase n=1 Tax=Ureibacillus aquaedulcis TaxID=3058421 RepID=A0ABT8GPS5_9BACL|nr:tyrosine-type recombinase/integrase [Ureibacillus sp. BA0131]MDN4493354.1 tyrosine-type recombinase/integrase [Ureibacillus sp. BA0131]